MVQPGVLEQSDVAFLWSNAFTWPQPLAMHRQLGIKSQKSKHRPVASFFWTVYETSKLNQKPTLNQNWSKSSTVYETRIHIVHQKPYTLLVVHQVKKTMTPAHFMSWEVREISLAQRLVGRYPRPSRGHHVISFIHCRRNDWSWGSQETWAAMGTNDVNFWSDFDNW